MPTIFVGKKLLSLDCMARSVTVMVGALRWTYLNSFKVAPSISDMNMEQYEEKVCFMDCKAKLPLRGGGRFPLCQDSFWGVPRTYFDGDVSNLVFRYMLGRVRG